MPLLRIVVPADSTPAVLDVLRSAPSCTSVVVTPGAALRPEGDMVLGEVGRVDVDAVVEALDAHDGVQVWLEDSEPLVTPATGRLDRDDAVMWAQVADMLGRSSRITTLFVLLIMLAGGIAAVGIIEDQLLLIIGAMALSPDYFPLIAGCLAVVRRRPRDLARSVATLAAGFAAAALAAWVLTEALLAAGLHDLSSSDESVVLFIARPTGLSVVVALLAGVAGALSVTLSDNRALVGVFVSVTTIPAAAGIGVALAVGDPDDMWGSAAQLGLNVVTLYAAGSVTLFAQRAYWRRRSPEGPRHFLDHHAG